MTPADYARHAVRALIAELSPRLDHCPPEHLPGVLDMLHQLTVWLDDGEAAL